MVVKGSQVLLMSGISKAVLVGYNRVPNILGFRAGLVSRWQEK